MTKKQLIEVIGSGEKTYLYFFAPWCEQCKKVNWLVERERRPVVRINGEENEEMLDAFGIEFYPTIVEVTGTKKRTHAGSKAVRQLLK